MPELPEVETIRRDLEHEVAGKTIVSVRVDGTRTVRRQDPEKFTEAVAGKRVQRFRRHGKFLFMDLDDGAVVALHLRMSGQLLWTPDASSPVVKHTHARIEFDNGEELRFVDPRTFGELWRTTRTAPELAHLGPDALNDVAGPAELGKRLSGRRSGLKTLLLNQAVIAGIGNIYSDEILFRARLRQTRTPDSLSKPALSRLWEAVTDVLREAVERRGSTLADQQYVDLYGRVGTAQREHDVYAREGQPCVVCERPIERIQIAGRSSFFCRKCQR